MNRRDFVKLTGAGVGAILAPLPAFSRPVAQESMLNPMDVARNKKMADIGLNAATSRGASYADIRIGRYLNQYLFTREKNVQNIVNTESYGLGIRVIADGTWGFASTNDVSEDGIKKAAEQAVLIAKANGKFQKEPVKLVPVKSHEKKGDYCASL